MPAASEFNAFPGPLQRFAGPCRYHPYLLSLIPYHFPKKWKPG